MKKIILQVKHFSSQANSWQELLQDGPYLRYKWFFVKKKVRRVYYEKD